MTLSPVIAHGGIEAIPFVAPVFTIIIGMAVMVIRDRLKYGPEDEAREPAPLDSARPPGLDHGR